ncbi:MAG TPA: hypothetical protein VF064_18000, partial [Pyrinomonadaceae bacterium]
RPDSSTTRTSSAKTGTPKSAVYPCSFYRSHTEPKRQPVVTEVLSTQIIDALVTAEAGGFAAHAD